MKRSIKNLTQSSSQNSLFIWGLMLFSLWTLVLPMKALATAPTAAPLTIEVVIPELNVNPYHKPYIAIWLETPDRQYVTTLVLLADDPEWHKDLRQWWRKVSRENVRIDGVTGATKRPSKFSLHWEGKNEHGQLIPAGNYLLNIEASREEGGRDYARAAITLGKKSEQVIEGKTEFGDIIIRTAQ